MAQAQGSGYNVDGEARSMPHAGGSAGSSRWQIWPIVLLTCSYLLFPPEVRLNAGGLNFPLYRLLIVLMLPVTLMRVATGGLRLAFADLCVLVSALWMIISFVAYYGPAGGFVRSIALTIDMAGSYFLARVSIRTPNDFRRLLIILAPILLLAGLELLVESLARKLIVRPAFVAIFGNLPAYNGGEAVGELNLRQDLRLGLLRAFGSFSHPILAGVVLTSSFAWFWSSGIRSWPKWVGLAAAFLGLFSLSSAAFLAIFIAIAIFVGDAFRKRIPGMTWWTISAFIIIIMTFLQVASKNGVVPILIRMTLDPQTGFYRLIIWEYGWKSIMHYPLIGIGFTPYERASFLSTSIDAHFLLLGVRHGIVAPLALFAGAVTTLIVLGKNVNRQPSVDRRCLFGVNISLFIMLITSMTVTFFSEANIWFMSAFAIAVSFSVYRVEKVT